jgi:hypothetical protein
VTKKIDVTKTNNNEGEQAQKTNKMKYIFNSAFSLKQLPTGKHVATIGHITITGAVPEGGATVARPLPLKLEKIRFFWRKIVIFHAKYPNNFFKVRI